MCYRIHIAHAINYVTYDFTLLIWEICFMKGSDMVSFLREGVPMTSLRDLIHSGQQSMWREWVMFFSTK
jgi:hypothetical protein